MLLLLSNTELYEDFSIDMSYLAMLAISMLAAPYFLIILSLGYSFLTSPIIFYLEKREKNNFFIKISLVLIFILLIHLLYIYTCFDGGCVVD
jgi:predicted PurR-regulated permease PerM